MDVKRSQMKVTRYVDKESIEALRAGLSGHEIGYLSLDDTKRIPITIELPDPPLEIEGLQDTENLTCVCVPASPGGPSCASEPPPCRKVALVEKGTQ